MRPWSRDDVPARVAERELRRSQRRDVRLDNLQLHPGTTFGRCATEARPGMPFTRRQSRFLRELRAVGVHAAEVHQSPVGAGLKCVVLTGIDAGADYPSRLRNKRCFCRWHAVGTQNYNVNLFHFAQPLGKSRVCGLL